MTIQTVIKENEDNNLKYLNDLQKTDEEKRKKRAAMITEGDQKPEELQYFAE